MDDAKDLYLKYVFTDRGDRDVFNINQEILHNEDSHAPPRFHTLGTLRITQPRANHAERHIVEVRWDGKSAG